jgi:hypothetical protein
MPNKGVKIRDEVLRKAFINRVNGKILQDRKRPSGDYTMLKICSSPVLKPAETRLEPKMKHNFSSLKKGVRINIAMKMPEENVSLSPNV